MISLASRTPVAQQRAGSAARSKPASCDGLDTEEGTPLGLSAYLEASIAPIDSQIRSRLAWHEAVGIRERESAFHTGYAQFLGQIAPCFSEEIVRRTLPHRLRAEKNVEELIAGKDVAADYILDGGHPASMPSGLLPRTGWLCGAEWASCRLYPSTEAERDWVRSARAIDRLRLSEADEEHLCSGARSALRLLARMIERAFNEPGKAAP